MSVHPACAVCGGAVPAAAPGCPRCLLEIGLEQTEAPAFEPGASFGEFEIVGLIGRGGMGTVYRARQPRLSRHVALKVLPASAAQDPEFGERFRREAQALAGLNHPHVVTLYDFGEFEDRSYLVMELFEGADLQQRLAGGAIPPREALGIARQISEALMHAHARGVVHRDIKPGNVLVGENGWVKLADFGLAKLLDSGGLSLSLTDSRHVMGTPFYIPPEQRRQTRAVDHRADIYALGVMLYQMLTGALPAGTFPAPSRVAPVGRRVDRLVARAMQHDPRQRFQRAADLRDALETCGRPAALRYLAPSGLCLILALLFALARMQDRGPSGPSVAPPVADGGARPEPLALPRDVVQLGPRYYKVFYQHLDWHAARRRCARLGGRLATVRDPAVDRFLARLSRTHVWLGGSDAVEEGVWRWSDGTRVRYTNWAEGEPNDVRQREHYLVLTKYGQWNDMAADSPIVKGFICEWDLDGHPGPSRLRSAAELHTALEQANPGYRGDGEVRVVAGQIREVDLAHAEISDVRPLAGLPLRRLNLSGTRVRDLWALAGLPLEELSLGRSRVADLAALAGLPLVRLKINGTAVTDLSPLRGMQLAYLDLSHTRVTSLAPLSGMPLVTLHMNRVRVTDLAVLRGMPLTTLGLLDVPVRDVSVLAGCARLESLHVPEGAPGLAALRSVRTLRRINNQPVARFWRNR